MAKCLIIGANGFIGSHLVDSLSAQGHSVRAFGRFKGDVLFSQHSAVEEFSGDFMNHQDIDEASRGMDYIFHFLSTTTPIAADNDPFIDMDTNVRMTIQLLETAVKNNIRKVIFASTSSLYGNIDGKPSRETDMPLPISPYTIGKLTIEHYLRYFRVKHGLDSVSFRISNPYGERQSLNRKQGVIPIFMDRVAQGKKVTILGDGGMERDYIYVKDVADIIAQVFDLDNKYEVYNLGSGKSVSVNALISQIEAVTKKSVLTEYKPAPPTFVHTVALDMSRFFEEFNIHPQTSLSDGMKATWDYVKNVYRGNL